MEYAYNALGSLITFLIFIVIPAPIWVALPYIMMVAGLVAAIARAR